MVNYIHFMINYWPWLHKHIGQATSPYLSTIRQILLLCCINQLIERKKKEKKKVEKEEKIVVLVKNNLKKKIWLWNLNPIKDFPSLLCYYWIQQNLYTY